MPRNSQRSHTNFTAYDPDGKEFYDKFMAKNCKVSQPTGPRNSRYGKCPTKLDELFGMFCSMRDEISELKQSNIELKTTVNRLVFNNAKLSSELEALDQYSRRENICFTNLKVDSSNTCEKQVVNLCNELGVDISSDDLVAAHPLPGKKSNRFIARFKERSNTQKVLANRKQSKVIAPNKKKTIFADSAKGVAIQPNITPKRAALLAQVKDAVHKFDFDSCWVDPKNCNIMLRVQKNGRPVPISSTVDLLDCAPNFEANDFVLCADPNLLQYLSDVSSVSSPNRDTIGNSKVN